MAQTDCIIIGYNDADFDENVRLIEATGTHSGAFRDYRLSCVEIEDRYLRPLDIFSRFNANENHSERKKYHDMDFMWPTILYLGSYLDKHGLSFDHVNLFQLEKEKLKTLLATHNPIAVAITTTLYVNPRPILEIIEFIRAHNSTVKIVVGGPYVSSLSSGGSPEDVASLLRYIGADFYVIDREGEAALVDLIRAIKSGADPGAIANLAFVDGKELIRTPSVPEQNALGDHPVDYALFDRSEIGEFLSIRTAKSCPFACAFCGFPERSGKYVYLSTAEVEEELNRVNDLGTVSTLTILDDTFNVPKRRFREILKMMIRNKYDFQWNSYYRCDRGDPEVIELMGEAKCEGVFLGIESGSDDMLRNMNKKCSNKNYREAIPQLKAAGISTHANFIVGYPGETRETYEETIALIEEAKPDYFLGQLWFCDPITPVGRQTEELGIKGTGFAWSHGTMDYQEASDLVEEMFFRVQNSVWLPQWGMAPWSTYYLQRNGLTRDQVKHFVRCYNDVVKYQVKNPSIKSIPETLMTPLQQSCVL
ncbi:PhpK family radical SAM P-methyltransferase [Roseivivax sp. CAU 1753]